MRLIIFLFFLSYSLLADSIGVEIITLTVHISDSSITNGDEYPRKLDDSNSIFNFE